MVKRLLSLGSNLRRADERISEVGSFDHCLGGLFTFSMCSLAGVCGCTDVSCRLSVVVYYARFLVFLS